MPTNPTIKPTAITRAGYEYQDLVGIEVLIRHFRDPNLFEWVQIESDDTEAKALDDVVALRKDGAVEYTQVKFTVNPEKYFLDWDWLLTKKANGTSMLAKWAASFFKAKALGRIHKAELRTNRVPSEDLMVALDGNHIDPSKIPDDLRENVEHECGGTKAATDFFREFQFTAAMPDLDRYEIQLRSQIVPSDTDQSGWLLLRDNVTRWAMLKGRPNPDGRILREHIVSLISKKRPRPIAQNFLVPDDYAPPDPDFEKQVRSRIGDRETSLTVVWGTPGRGKSTFLSYLFNELKREKKAVVRHHYFLSNAESSADRTSYFDVATSLIQQIRRDFPQHIEVSSNDVDELRKVIEKVAHHLGESGEILYLLVDGLDHVYRDTNRVDQVDHLFNTLFPLPENVSLLVGTQRVSNEQLPQKLLTSSEPEDWIEIPGMSEAAVKRWLKVQFEAQRAELKWPEQRERVLGQVATKFWEKCAGHPLHLIYAFEMLARRGMPIDEYDVESVPACPDGDIRKYYKGLWVRLSSKAQKTLHALAGSEFYWPARGILECFGDYQEVEFLFEPHPSGLRPFHESIFAWLRERSDHSTAFQACLPDMISWLRDLAPDYWRWGWLSLAEAKNDDAARLISEANPDWVQSSLALGWPEKQIARVLGEAEARTFQLGDLASTVKIRSLKVRVMNAREFQAHEFGKFQSIALSISNNEQQARNLLDDIMFLSEEEIASLAKLGPIVCNEEIRNACRDELVRRINTWISMRHRSEQDFLALTRRFIEVSAMLGQEHVENVVAFLKGFKRPNEYFLEYAEELASSLDLESLSSLQTKMRQEELWSVLSEINGIALRTALKCGAEPLEFMDLSCPMLAPDVASWLHLTGSAMPNGLSFWDVPENLFQDRYSYSESSDLVKFFHQSFWIALYFARTAQGDHSIYYPILKRRKLKVVDEVLNCLKNLASSLTDGTRDWTLSAAYLQAAEVPEIIFSGNDDGQYSQYLSFRKALWRIALDIHYFGLVGCDERGICKDEFDCARASIHWNDDAWLKNNADLLFPDVHAAVAASIAEDKAQSLSREVTQFDERTSDWTNLAVFCFLTGTGDPNDMIRRASSCLVGYLYRKDMAIFDVLDSVGYIAQHDQSKAEEWIRTIEPIVAEISNFTDGDETRHARSELIGLVAQVKPSWLPKFHSKHLEAEEWHLVEEVLKKQIEISDFSTPEGSGLARTLTEPVPLYSLSKRAEKDDDAKRLLEIQTAFLGGRPEKRERFRSSADRELDQAELDLLNRDPSNFEADDFVGLVDWISQPKFPYQHKPEFLEKWLSHWESAKKARTTLKAIEEQVELHEVTREVDEVFDLAFQTSLKTEGKNTAYKWLVRAQVYRRGWDSYWTSKEETLNRLTTAATSYQSKWLQFIQDTSKPDDRYTSSAGDLAVGRNRLVFFLVAAEQYQQAIDVTEAMIQDLVDQLLDQPIEETKWLN